MSNILIQENISLQTHNTLAVPVKARWFAEVKSIADIKQSLSFKEKQDCSLIVISDGSNVVFQKDFEGLVIKINISGLNVEQETDEDVLVSVAAGENWHQLVMYTVDNDWYGIENLALIPGKVGAAPIQNIGAYGVELVDNFVYLEAVDVQSGQLHRFNKVDCQFDYRDSIFKHELLDKVIITRVVLRLSKQKKFCLKYPALKEELRNVDSSELTARDIANAIIAIRGRKLPDPQSIPNAGSFFKNPIVPQATLEDLIKKYPDIVYYNENNHHVKLAAGWLLDKAGWKGKMVDGFCMHKKQALVLTNPNCLSGLELMDFVYHVQQDIYQQYGINLEIEPRVYS